MPSVITTITLEKLDIFHKYKANKTIFEQEATPKEKRLFGKTSWSMILQIYRTLELAQKNPNPSNITSAILTVRTNCDFECFKNLSQKIPYYEDFQQAENILLELRDKIQLETNLSSAGDETYFSFVGKMTFDATRLGLCEFDILDKVNSDFLPKGKYEDLATANGWRELYVELAEKFDVIYQKLKKEKKNRDENLDV